MGKRQSGIGGDLMHEVEGDGLDGRSAIAAVGREAVDIGPRDESIEVDAGDGVEGVDGGDAIGAAARRRTRHLADVGDVGRELHEHRGAGYFFHPLGDHLRVFGNLADGAAHAALAHAMGTAEIELQSIAAGVFGLTDDFVPRFALRFDHERGDDGVLRDSGA